MFFAPFIPPNCDKPPTVYAVLNSIVNGDKEIDDEQVKGVNQMLNAFIK